MKRTSPLTLLVGATLLSAGCAPPPRPAKLVEADQARSAPAVQQASAFAPQMLAHAESLRRQAEQAYDQGDVSGAGMLAERALVAYERAAVLARTARAERTASEAEQALGQANEEQRLLDAEKARLEADIDTIEQLIRVVKDAQPITPSPKGDHSREMARMKAARAIVVDARLLCSAAKLLQKPLEGFDETLAEVQRLEDLLVGWPTPAPIDETIRVRARCLSFLTLARRAGDSSTPADLVLTELSKHPGMQPIRDDRGIVVSLRGDPQRAENKARVDALAATARTFTHYPLLVVSHTRARPSAATTSSAKSRADLVVDALLAAGVKEDRIEKVHAGPHRPVVHDPLPPPNNSENDRVEVVLVAPSF